MFQSHISSWGLRNCIFPLHLNTTQASCSPPLSTWSTHHELTLCQTLQRDGTEDPGFMAALLGYLRALPRQLPVLGGAQLGGDYLENKRDCRHISEWLQHCIHPNWPNGPCSDVPQHMSQNAEQFWHISDFLTWRPHCISHTNVDGESLTSADPQPRKLTSPRACRLFTAPTMTWWSTPRLAATSKLSTPSSTFSIRRRSVSTTLVSAMLEPCEALKRPDVTSPPERPYVLE